MCFLCRSGSRNHLELASAVPVEPDAGRPGATISMLQCFKNVRKSSAFRRPRTPAKVETSEFPSVNRMLPQNVETHLASKRVSALVRTLPFVVAEIKLNFERTLTL